jgi:hypothetical protein
MRDIDELLGDPERGTYMAMTAVGIALVCALLLTGYENPFGVLYMSEDAAAATVTGVVGLACIFAGRGLLRHPTLVPRLCGWAVIVVSTIVICLVANPA